jgi:hypothetical protein
MLDLNLPKIYDLGFGDVIEVKYLESTFGISRRLALKYLTVLKIKPLYIGKEVFFCLATFKKIMYVLSRPGSPGFIFPGSNAKSNQVKRKSGEYIVEVTDAILKEAASPQIMAEMIATEGRDSSMVKKLLTHPQQETKK